MIYGRPLFKSWEPPVSPDLHAILGGLLFLYGVITMAYPEGWLEKPGYDFLDGKNLKFLSGIIVLLGIIQIYGAFSRITWVRVLAASFGILHWWSFARGGFAHDSIAYVPYFCAGLAAANVVAAWRS